jgi:hypothetical protein
MKYKQYNTCDCIGGHCISLNGRRIYFESKEADVILENVTLPYPTCFKSGDVMSISAADDLLKWKGEK